MRSVFVSCLCLAGGMFDANASVVHIGATPHLKVKDLKGNEFDLDQQRGRIVLVHFFATWCPGCELELPVLEAFSAKHATEGVQVVMLTPEHARSLGAIRKMLGSRDLRTARIDEASVNDFGIPGTLPSTFLLNKNGEVRFSFSPDSKVLTRDELENAYESLMTQNADAGVSFDPKWVKVTGQCKTQKSPGSVLFLKQWHLSPKANTRDQVTKLPQDQNQDSIFTQVSEWVKNKEVDTILVEGCTWPTEVKEGFTTVFNGWSLRDLIKLKGTPALKASQTHVGLKLKAQFGDAIKVLCSDDSEKINQQQLALSDARADLGYWNRLKDSVDHDDLRKSYLESANEAFHLQKDTNYLETMSVIKGSLITDLKKVDELLDVRSDLLAKHVLEIAAKSKLPPVLIWGGLHADRTREQLEKGRMNCSIVTPLGYEDTEEKTIKSFGIALPAHQERK